MRAFVSASGGVVEEDDMIAKAFETTQRKIYKNKVPTKEENKVIKVAFFFLERIGKQYVVA